MVAVGRLATRLDAVRQSVIRVAGFRTTSQATVPNGAAPEDFGVTYRGDSLSGYLRGFATKDGADEVTGAEMTSASSGDIGEEMRVDTMVREELEEPEGGPEPGVKEKAKQAVSKVGEKVRDAGKAITGNTDNDAAEKVGETVKGAGESIKDKGEDKKTLGEEGVVTS